MFHEGDLNSGISRAISEEKLVACFVREDGNEESRVWEEEWLEQKPRTVSHGEQRPNLGELYATKAVILRISLGTQEAGFLNAFCPVTSAPTFVVIHNGRVLEKVEAGVGKQEFLERASRALGLEMNVMSLREFHEMREAQGNRGPEEIADAVVVGRDAQRPESIDDSADGEGFPSQATSPGVATPDSSDTVPVATHAGDQPHSPSSQLLQEEQAAGMNSLFPDRAQRMEAEKAKREAAEKAARIARQNARRKEAEDAHKAHQGKGKEKAQESLQKDKARQDWLVKEKQRKEEAKQERERILKQIEADRMERKLRDQRPVEAPSTPLPPAMVAASRRRTGAGGVCHLSVRLFDGSSIKERFEPSATLGKNVRDWIRGATVDPNNPNAAELPFTFKQIMAPLPSRHIEVSEEHQSVTELGLVPNANLVLVPVTSYTEAYRGGGGGYMSSAFNAVYGIVRAVIGIFSLALSFLLGSGNAASTSTELTDSSNTEHDRTESSGSPAANTKVKTLADQRAEAAKKQGSQPEFYNGNSSAFQGRKDDESNDQDDSR